MNVRAATIPITGLMSAEFLSLLGNQIAAVAIPILVLQYTQSPIITGIASAGGVTIEFTGVKTVLVFEGVLLMIATILGCITAPLQARS